MATQICIYFHPGSLGKWSNLTTVIFFRWVETNHQLDKFQPLFQGFFCGIVRSPFPSSSTWFGLGKPLVGIWLDHWLGSDTGETQHAVQEAYVGVSLPPEINTRWWFQIFFIFTPKIGEMIQFDEHIFHRGWNHQLGKIIGDESLGQISLRPKCRLVTPNGSKWWFTGMSMVLVLSST